jgi:uncharacterized protein YjbJ (UPF0337 family)
VEDNWKRIKGRVRECWGAFRNKELDKIAGKRNQLEGKMQGRYGTAKKGLLRRIRFASIKELFGPAE